MNRQSYHELPGFEQVYLEDSYVLAVMEHPACLEFSLDLVLTEQHPAYAPPGPEEQYCYRRARLLFPEATNIRWLRQNLRPYQDATGTCDYGNIDELVAVNGHYRITGDWGVVEVVSASPALEILEGIGVSGESS